METSKKTPPPIFIASGGHGLSGNNMVQALLIQYPENNVPVVIVPNISTEEQIFDLVAKVKAEGGIITHTMVHPGLRQYMNKTGKEFGVKTIDFMGDLAAYLDNLLEVPPLKTPGLYREINYQYFDRIEAIEFTLSQDDGMNPQHLHEAEIILTGLSRAGKTPLSIFLAMYGWKVANVPLVKGVQPPAELFEVDPKRVFGLHIGANQLIKHRWKRLQDWNNMENNDYIDENSVREEIKHALFVFERGGFTIINVSHKPVESSANEILNLLAQRFSFGDRRMNPPYREVPK